MCFLLPPLSLWEIKVYSLFSSLRYFLRLQFCSGLRFLLSQSFIIVVKVALCPVPQGYSFFLLHLTIICYLLNWFQIIDPNLYRIEFMYLELDWLWLGFWFIGQSVPKLTGTFLTISKAYSNRITQVVTWSTLYLSLECSSSSSQKSWWALKINIYGPIICWGPYHMKNCNW